MLRREGLFLLLAVPAALAWTTPTPQPRMPVAARGPPPSSLLPTELQKPTSSLLPFGVLMMVPVAWGTYGVSVKSCYALTSPPPELAFGLLQYVISSSVLSFALFAAQPQEPPAPSSQKPTASAAAAGLELGGYLFVAALLQIFGLGMTTATRGAFIVQALPRSGHPPRSRRPPRAVTLPPPRSPSHSHLWPPPAAADDDHRAADGRRHQADGAVEADARCVRAGLRRRDRARPGGAGARDGLDADGRQPHWRRGAHLLAAQLMEKRPSTLLEDSAPGCLPGPSGGSARSYAVQRAT